MPNLPELSDSTKRKLELRWRALLDSNGLTGEHFHWHEQERDRLRRLAAQSPTGVPGVPHSLRKPTTDDIGVVASVTVAAERFNGLTLEYGRVWRSSGDRYESLVGWLEVLKQRVSIEIASIWAGASKSIERWYQRACRPAVEETLAKLVKDASASARTMELAVLDREKVATEPEQAAVIVDRKGERRELVDDFLNRCNQELAIGSRIVKHHIWQAAGYKQGRQFLYWQQGNAKATGVDQRIFSRILAMAPGDFILLLRKKHCLK
jgi:hypothetical protein